MTFLGCVATRLSSFTLVLALTACGGNPSDASRAEPNEASDRLAMPGATNTPAATSVTGDPTTDGSSAAATSGGSVNAGNEMIDVITGPIDGTDQTAAEGSTPAGEVASPDATNTPAASPQPWELKRAALLEIIGRPQVPLDIQETARPDDTGLTVQDFSIATDESTRINGTIFAPKLEGRLPTILYLHGTGGSRQEGLYLLRTLAQSGFLALAIDARHHGPGVAPNAYVNAIFNSYVTGEGHPFLYDTVWDVMRLLDYLEQRSDVDATRIGLVGNSKGGMETYLAAAIEPRIAVAVPWISVESFGWALDNDQWQARVGSIQGAFDQAAAYDGVPITADFVRQVYARVVPGITDEFDGPEMVAAIAPRPLLAVNGEFDPRTPKGGLDLCEASARAAYDAAGAADKFELYIEPDTGHAVTAEAITRTVDWLARWLE